MEKTIQPAISMSESNLETGQEHVSNQHRCEHVLRIVAGYFGHPMVELLASTRREKHVAFARQVAMYLAHTHYSIPLSEIGKNFGRDRTTISFGCRKIEDSRDEPETDTILCCLEMLLMNGDQSPLIAFTAKPAAIGAVHA